MANPYRDGGAAKAKLKRMLGQAPGKNVGKFADAPASEDEIKRFTSGYDIRMPGGVEKSKTRLDRRARGGRTSKKKGHTTVNVLVGGHGAPQPSPVPVPVGGGGGAPMLPSRPPMPPVPPMAGPMPGGPPGMAGPGGPLMPPPGMMPPRKRGGKVVGDKGPASGKSTPLGVKKGQSGWKVPRIHVKPKSPERNTRG